MSDENIKIMSGLKFDLDDLVKVVDFSHPFTLKDILTICVNSEILIEDLKSILRCHYINDYYEEMNKEPFKPEGGIEYLEVYWWGVKDDFDGKKWCESSWNFHGVGFLNSYSQDMIDAYKLTGKELPKDYRETYGIEFTPIYSLADYEIRMSPELHMTDYAAHEMDKKIEFTPSITLIELLNAIFYELSFCGSIQQREEKMLELKKTIDEIDEASKNGKLDEVTISHEEAEKRFKDKFGG